MTTAFDELTRAYVESCEAQALMIGLLQSLQSGAAPAPGQWTDAEEALETARDRFRAAREASRHEAPRIHPSPGLAGGLGDATGELRVIARHSGSPRPPEGI